jgi:hypothetical protein
MASDPLCFGADREGPTVGELHRFALLQGLLEDRQGPLHRRHGLARRDAFLFPQHRNEIRLHHSLPPRSERRMIGFLSLRHRHEDYRHRENNNDN